MSKSTGRAYAELTMVMAIWAGTFIAAKYALAEHGPMKLAAVRFAIATLVLFPIVWYRERQALRPHARDWIPFLITGFLTVFVYQTCFFTGLKHTGAVNGSLVVAANPIVTAFLASLILRELLRAGQWVGIAISFVGECIVISRGSWQNIVSLQFNRGDLLLLLAVLSWVVNALYLRKLGNRISALVLSAWSCLFGALFLLPFGWMESPAGIPTHWLWTVITIVLYIAIPSTALTTIWWFDGIARLGPSRSAIFIILVPVFVMVFTLLAGKSIDLNQVLGAAFVICGVYLVTRQWEAATASVEV